jgi:hypothetical protein
MALVDEGHREIQVRVVCVGRTAADYVTRLEGGVRPDAIVPLSEAVTQAIDHDPRIRVFAFRPALPRAASGYGARFVVVAAQAGLDEDDGTRLLTNVDLVTFVASGDDLDGERWEIIANILRFGLLYRDVPVLVLLDRATAAPETTLDAVRAECGLFDAPAAEIATHTGEGVAEGFMVGARLVANLLTHEE